MVWGNILIVKSIQLDCENSKAGFANAVVQHGPNRIVGRSKKPGMTDSGVA